MDSPKEKLRDSAMAENKKNILDCISLVGTSPCIFEGEKTYISTGAVNHDYIDLSLTEKVTYQNRPSRANLSVKNGDILFAKMCGTQKTVRIDKKNAEYLFSTGFYAVRAKETVITSPLLYYLLDSEQFLKQKDQNCSGATQKAITNEGLKKIKISLPPLEEQHKIAAVLDKISDLIAKRRQQLDRLDELVKSRFVEMFGDHHTNNKGFDLHTGSELFQFSSGKFLPEEKRKATGIPVYGGNGIAWYTDEALINYPTIIIGRVGAWCGNVHTVTEPVWITDNAIYIKKQKTEQFTLEFLTELMKAMDFHQYADFSGQPKISQKPLESLNYLTPPLDLQNQFAAFVDQTEKTKTTISHSLEKLETLKKALMQEYFG